MSAVIRPAECNTARAPDAARRIADGPIAYLHLEHYTQMALCSMLARLALGLDPSQTTAAADAEAVLHYLVGELPCHEEDEEEDVSFLLRQRGPRHSVDPLLNRLLAFHQEDRLLADALLPDLAALSLSCTPRSPRRFAERAGRFARSWYAHLRWENAEFLPFASEALGDGDRSWLAKKMIARRSPKRATCQDVSLALASLGSSARWPGVSRPKAFDSEKDGSVPQSNTTIQSPGEQPFSTERDAPGPRRPNSMVSRFKPRASSSKQRRLPTSATRKSPPNP